MEVGVVGLALLYFLLEGGGRLGSYSLTLWVCEHCVGFFSPDIWFYVRSSYDRGVTPKSTVWIEVVFLGLLVCVRFYGFCGMNKIVGYLRLLREILES